MIQKKAPDEYWKQYLGKLGKGDLQINDALRDVKEWSDTQISNGYLGDQTV